MSLQIVAGSDVKRAAADPLNASIAAALSGLC